MNKVVSLQKFKMEKSYRQNGSVSINLALDDTTFQVKKNIRQSMTKGYLELLSNQINK
jgi:hypothetical protein